MAISRTQGVVAISSQSVAAGGSVQSAAVTMGNTNFMAGVYGTITNGASAPTTPMRIALEVNNGSGWVDTGYGAVGGIQVSTAYPFSFQVPITAFQWRINALGHAGNAVTVVGYYDLLVTPQ